MSKKYEVPKVKLNNGLEMPAIGLGTYKSLENDAYNAVKAAIDLGYRHIDTAFFYMNEEEVGKAIREKISEGIITRADIFVTTKLWPTFHEPESVVKACKRSLDNLGLEYIDLYLIHWPFALKYYADDCYIPRDSAGNWETTDRDYCDVYKKLEECVKLGYVRSIGLSNFNSVQIQRVLDIATIKPVVNQVECSLQINQKPLVKFCKERGIVVTGYCPLARPEPANKKPAFLFNDEVAAIGKKYGKSAAQVALRYLVEIGVVPLPKSSNPKRIEENLNIFDFKLDEGDLKLLDKFHTGERTVWFTEAEKCVNYPFHQEF
ncbi:aldo-keto reductase family 1 member B1-like [Culicoides brevitarsis]|uniref:aldo-keto reductase family 1 member B1-like n=1 Tax=Culicoides brevitarsis TaxID=469753 RepID=UPI00307B23C5